MADNVHTMPMDEILNLMSADFDERVRNCLADINFDRDAEFYGKLRARMQETKTNAVPIYVAGGILYNGHHRVKIAHDLGFQEMQVTTDYEQLRYSDVNWRVLI